ncbi:hypothetical protein F4703DRAFT_1817020 [Phycomyces blakesleeanus]|uniref:TM2 domain-containing protein n=2 Tax=Phycomyces blakesleeanus TaxID=4837 RepID=A0A167MT78_PHYB8|nr:hypothetical protein PHYBLDRAFT_186964 [Phycomyces blakesleeanus NRRL 1555(-)]OAD73869.1 hypothetical protein PHYBLDRAFT_186964 [Phycomyces blakesleeanus NRRL 1555(-)]|eukprot:XP_018291909.1 hypothetical protein PHYBLDRAFT_186964 [Phycomyces blakesleeanus NRRL 1555(-)]
MSTEYGTVRTQDEEAPLLNIQIVPETFWQKTKRVLHLHGHRVLITWLIIIAATAVLTLSFHFALVPTQRPSEDPVEGSPVDSECVSDRSWFLTLMLSIFFGPFGVDRFYLGYVFLGLLKLVTAGLGGIWWTIDIILIALNVLNDHPDGCHLR